MSETDSGGAALYESIEKLLIERGPLSVAELVDALEPAGFDQDSDAEEELLDELYDSLGDEFTPLVDGRWAYPPALLDSRTFTHRLTFLEVVHDVLTLTPDLVAVRALSDVGQLRLVDGSPLPVAHPEPLEAASEHPGRPEESLDDFGSLLLPPGTCAGLGVGEGDLVSLTVTARGIQLTKVAEDEVHSHPHDVGRLFAEIVAGDKPTELETAVLSVCGGSDHAFRVPCSPLTELLAEAGVARYGDWVAPDGFAFADYWARNQTSVIAERYELDPDEAFAVNALSMLHQQLTDELDGLLPTPDSNIEPATGVPASESSLASVLRQASETVGADAGEPPTGTAHTVGSMLPFVARPGVASALWEETIASAEGEGGREATALVLMVDSLEPRASRASRPALRWLRAKALESLDRVSDAEDDLQAAERLDPSWPLTLLDLARYASDRGDAPRGLALLARAAPYVDADLEQLLRAFQPKAGPTLGRNQPCWCGSGRKFKQCHLHRPSLPPLKERAAWLYHKAGRFLSDGLWYPEVLQVALERSAYSEDESDVEAAVTDPLVADSVLFEGGAFLHFVESRGFLLPGDERLLAEQWLLVERSVFDVTAVRRDAGFTARDLRTGDTHEVRDRAASRSVRTGDLICARIVPTGDTMQVFGGIEPVTLHDRDALLSLLDEGPGPAELVAFLSRRFAPPSLANTEGDPIVICDVVVAASDPDALTAALDQAYRRVEDTDQREWVFEREIDGLDRICARLRLTGSDLHVNTNSERRMDDVLATLRQLDPAGVVVSDERQPMRDTREAAQLAKALPSGGSGASNGLIAPEEMTPELLDAMAEHIRTYEEQWLDLAIPALHGLTPREAADDPTRRDDLVRLLASFDAGEDSPMAMSPRRLRAALGLSTDT